MRKYMVAGLLSVAIWHGPANAQIAESLATGVVLDELQSQLDTAITSALQAGDLLIYQAGVEARDAIAAWKQANGNLLDKTFSSLDDTTKTIFSKTDTLIDKIDAKTGDRLAQAQELGDTGVLISTSIIPTQQRTLITRYSPRVFAPQTGTPRVVTIYGANIAEAKPLITLPDGVKISPVSLTSQAASFIIPASFLSNPINASTVVTAQLGYTRNASAIFKKRVQKSLAFWTLPPVMGSYTAVATVERPNRVTDMAVIHTGELSGKDKNILKGINPPSGWLFDLPRVDSSATLVGNGGEAGRCQIIAPQDRSESGVMVQVHVDHTRDWKGSKKSGWIRCIATMPIYKVDQIRQALPPTTGEIAWSSDLHITPPEGIRSWAVSIKTMDGRTRQFTGSGLDQLFQLTADTSGVLIKPLPPKGF
ncbi:hypothetical protein [Sphingomonas sp. TWP1-3-1]|uniref:hypothetical protein n=1 Tax=Sphingomonas sp. TWP1-3-1 TaxID=2804612 RepID=UPI003CE8B336